MKSGRGARSARPQRPSRRTGGDTDDHPIAPTKPLSASPHAVIQPGRPCGRGLAAAYGPRVEGPTPWTTLANSGSHGAAPSRNLSFRCGQRPSVHRLQRCRGPSGPRASGAAAAPHVHRDVDPGPVTRLRRHGRAPRGHSELRMASGGREDTGQTQSAAAADVLLRGRLLGPEGVELTHPGKRDDRAGKSSGELVLASTQTLRRPSGAQMSCNPSLSQKLLGGTRFTMAVVRARSFPHTMWAAFYLRTGT